MSNKVLRLFKSKNYDVRVFNPRTLEVIPRPRRVLKKSQKGIFYDLFSPNWINQLSFKLARQNLKNNVFPCIDLKLLYLKTEKFDYEYYLKGSLLGIYMRTSPLLIYNEGFPLKIPDHILIRHLSKWTNIPQARVRDSLIEAIYLVLPFLNWTAPQIKALYPDSAIQ